MKTPEQVEAWGLRIARETGYDGGNLKSLAWRSHKVRITNETAARWARTARVAGMQLHINTTDPALPWARTDCGHVVTREVGRGSTTYAVTSPWWDHPIRFTASGRHGLARLAQLLGPFALFIDGAYAEEDDDGLDSEGMEILPLFQTTSAQRVAA